MRKWVKFPNGKVWREKNGSIVGSVTVPNYENIDSLEDKLDAIAEAATGSILGLTDFAYQYRGGDIVSFQGCAEELPEDEDDYAEEGYRHLNHNSDELRAALAKQYGLMDVEVDHALTAIDNQYGEECVLAGVGSGRELRCPAYPEECTYVRIVVDGLEIAYWIEDEWRDAPAEVMGAIIGAAIGNRMST